ncbi:MAG: beta-ketoacyl-[acyl-carrier-protein] synthase family protein [Alphaproteobacteria bacterium]
MKPVYINASTLVSSIGIGREASFTALENEKTGLRPYDFVPWDIEKIGFKNDILECFIGRVEDVENEKIDASLAPYNTRANCLTQMALKQDGFEEAVYKAKEKYGAQRVGVIMGTSAAGVLTTEEAYYKRKENGDLPDDFSFEHTNDLASVTGFIKAYLGLEGLAYTVSTACSSSAKVFVDAYQALESGLCDAVVVGGTEGICFTSLYGFNSLELLSKNACMPCDANRKGISIGEGAAFCLMEKTPEGDNPFAFTGYGESSDAYHMSTPHPEGLGAQAAMTAALERAGVTPTEIDYINMHGTGTAVNDQVESIAIHSVFGKNVPCSSTKGWTGHTLGTAGILEVVFAMLAIEKNFLPKNLGCQEIDPAIQTQLLMTAEENKEISRVLTNSFGFGGNNCSLILERSAS